MRSNFPQNSPHIPNRNLPAHQQVSTIQSLQSYITELTTYINQNNQIFTNNLQTVTEFYHEQIQQLNDTIAQQEEQNIGYKNELASMETLILNKNTEIKGYQEKVGQLKESLEETESKLKMEREAKERAFGDVDRIRDQMVKKMERAIEKCTIAEEKQQSLANELKDKQAEIARQKKQIKNLEDQVAERYSMPDKIKTLQMQSIKQNSTIANQKQKISQLQASIDFTSVQLSKLRKQNQKLRIDLNKAKGDQSYQIQKSLKKERQKFYEEIEKVKLENERLVFQIGDLQNKMKNTIRDKQKLEIIVSGLEKTENEQKRQIEELKDDKNLYLDEFRKLKEQYEGVIDNLQNAIPQYQSKNWALQEENQELNSQLNGLQELLREVKAMNDMEPFRKEYRQWAQLNLAAQRKLPEQYNQNYKKMEQEKEEKIYLKRDESDEFGADWKKIMADIESISI